MSLSPAPPPSEPHTHAQAHDGKDLTEDEKGNADKDKVDERSDEERSDASNKDKDDSGESEVPSSSENESDDPEMIELLRQASESESESDADADPSRPLGTQEAQVRRPAKRRRGDDSPAGTIAVLVQACWMLRIPIIYNDLIR